MKNIKSAGNVISALKARSHFGRILEEVGRGGRSFVIEKRGSPTAVLLGVQDYVRLAAPEPEILRSLGEASSRRGTDKLTMRQIERAIKLSRANRRRAAA
jgi:prevent-host-death family protein